MNEQKLKNIESRQNILEHIIRVMFGLVKSKLDNAIVKQIENALLTLTDLKK